MYKKIGFLVLFIIYLVSPSNGAVSITNFSLSSTSLEFDIDGTFPSLVPNAFQALILFSNPNSFLAPSFRIRDAFPSSTQSFSGSQQLSTYAINTGGTSFGDAFYVAFNNNFTAGESINGRVTASWNADAFDPSVVSSLSVFWGTGGFFSPAPTGTFLTTVPVPEPSAFSLLAVGLGALAMMRCRRS